jgi:hypothetical protein
MRPLVFFLNVTSFHPSIFVLPLQLCAMMFSLLATSQSFSFASQWLLGRRKTFLLSLQGLGGSAVTARCSKRRSHVFSDNGRWVTHGEAENWAGGRGRCLLSCSLRTHTGSSTEQKAAWNSEASSRKDKLCIFTDKGTEVVLVNLDSKTSSNFSSMPAAACLGV